MDLRRRQAGDVALPVARVRRPARIPPRERQRDEQERGGGGADGAAQQPPRRRAEILFTVCTGLSATVAVLSIVPCMLSAVNERRPLALIA